MWDLRHHLLGWWRERGGDTFLSTQTCLKQRMKGTFYRGSGGRKAMRKGDGD